MACSTENREDATTLLPYKSALILDCKANWKYKVLTDDESLDNLYQLLFLWFLGML